MTPRLRVQPAGQVFLSNVPIRGESCRPRLVSAGACGAFIERSSILLIRGCWKRKVVAKLLRKLPRASARGLESRNRLGVSTPIANPPNFICLSGLVGSQLTFRYDTLRKTPCIGARIDYTDNMSPQTKSLILLLGAILLLAGCSTKITAPVGSRWQVVPCEYKLTGDDESILQVRALVADFDSAKIVVHTFHWTVYGDTLSRETVLYPREQKTAKVYTIFTADRSLPINSVLRSVQLFIKN